MLKACEWDGERERLSEGVLWTEKESSIRCQKVKAKGKNEEEEFYTHFYEILRRTK